MKKMYFLTILIIVVITLGFLLYSSDADVINRRFLSMYEIKTRPKAIEISEFEIPENFDKIYEDYNFLQIEAGLNLEPYKGRNAVRYTYVVTNYTENIDVHANVICVDRLPIGGDIMCPAIDGFIKPLNSIMSY